MEKALQPVRAPWEMSWIDGADHSLGTAAALAQISETVRRWLSRRERPAQPAH
jgi:hypothetical protein